MASGWVRRGEVTRNMGWHTYTVKSGDTLAKIAKTVTPAQTVAYLKKWNGLSDDKVSVGKSIKIYPYYVVQWGDTAGDVAKSFNTTASALHKVNPWIKNINLIYPKEKIRLLEGMEPEVAPPKPVVAPKPEPKPEPDSPAPKVNKRDGVAPDYDDDDFPAHRKIAGDYFLRIGDVQLVVPPEFIKVSREGNVNQRGLIRQTESLKFKNGQSMTQIDIQLWFTNLEEINGFRMASPMPGQEYFMDGLRPLIAQFKRQPFLPIVNEFLNDTMDIHAVALSNLSFSTVEGFPDVIQASLTLMKMEVSPYINKPSWTYDQHFMYPLFRWYYNQLLVEKQPSYSTTYMRPVYEADFTDDFQFEILNEGFLQEKQAESKLKSLELNDMAYDKIDLGDTLHCTNIFGALGTVLAPLQMDLKENPTFQYMGSQDTMFNVSFETTDRDAIAVLERMFSTLERYSRLYRDKIVTGYAKVKNSLLNMAGVYNVMIMDMKVSTVPTMPDLFRIDMTLISYKDTQYQDQRIKGFSMVDSKGASDIAADGVGPAEKYLYSKSEPWFLVEEGIAEGMLDTMELYPDLELPPYMVLNDVVKKINAHRKGRKQSALPIDSYAPPRHLMRDYGKENYKVRNLPDSAFADPDFYFTYPEWSNMKYVDEESVINGMLTAEGLAAGYTAKTGGGDTAQDYGKGVSGLPTSADYSGPDSSAAKNSSGKSYKTGIKAQLAGTDKWNTNIIGWANKYNINPLFIKIIIAFESGGNASLVEKGVSGREPGRGLFQITPGRVGFDVDPSRLHDVDYAVVQFAKVVESKISAAKGDLSVKEIAWRYNGKVAGNPYPDAFMEVYRGLGGGANDTIRADGSTAPGRGTSMPAAVSEALFAHAEADVMVRIPKTEAEEGEITAESANPNALMRSMLHDHTKYSKRGTMIRAYPTFVLAFVDEGLFVDYRRMWNNYYLYHAIEEINLVKERNQPVDTLHLRLVNIYGALNSTNRPLTKAITKDVRFPGWSASPKAVGSAISWYWHQWFPEVNDSMVQRRLEHTQKQGFNLRTGARVHLRMGYGSTASLMPVVFNGRITEIDSSDVVEVIAQSDGLELINPYHEWAADARTTWWNMKQEPKNIIDDFMVNRKGLDWLANYDGLFGAFADGGTMSKYGIEHFGYVMGKGYTQEGGFQKWTGWFKDSFKGMLGMEVVNGYDARKNVYAANGVGAFGQSEKGSVDERNVHFWMTNKSPWDIIQLLTAIAPDYETKIIEHGFHSTLFYGQPQWYVKYAYYNESGKPDDIGGYKELMKVAQQYHHIDSLSDIITNNAKTSDKDICTIAVPMYSWDEKPKAGDTLFADPYIKPEMQKTEIIDVGLLQDFPMGDLVAQVMRWTGHQATEALNDIGEMLKAIPGGGVIEDFGDLLTKIKVIEEDSRTEQLAKEAAKTHMQWKFRDMYKGDIVILGDAAIKPGDMINLADVYTQMFGIVETGRVVHMMSLNEGFITSWKPDMLSVRKDGYRAEQLSNWFNVGAYMTQKILFALMKSYVLKKPRNMIAALPFSKAKKFIRGIRTTRNAIASKGIAGTLAFGPYGLAAIIYELALWTISGLIIDAIEKIVIKQRAGVILMPLWYKNRPYVAGIDGHKELIPGYWDENYYGAPDASMMGSGGGGAMTGDAAYIPEGYKMCYPTISTRVTSKYLEPRSGYIHQGVDFGAMVRGVDGDPLYAIANGTVAFSGSLIKKGKLDGYGHYMIIEHETFYSIYGHMQYKPSIPKGTKVSLGQVIGKMGNTGRSSGTHLHFEVRDKSGKTPLGGKVKDPMATLKNGKAYVIPKKK